MKETTLQWLEFAKADLMSCENNLHDGFLTGIVAFNAQQAVEKSLKAVIDHNNIKLPRVHDLFKLYSNAEGYLRFEIDLDLLKLLDRVYTNSRYPGETGLMPNGKPTIKDAREMYEFAKSIYEKIVQTLDV